MPGMHVMPAVVRHRRLLLAVTPLAAGALVLAVVAGGDDSAGGTQLGPTVAAERRDLATTLEASGSLQRSSELSVTHAGTLPSDGGDGGDGAMAPVSYYTGDGSTTSTSSTTTAPCSPTSTSSTSTSTSSSSTTSTIPCPTTTSSSSATSTTSTSTTSTSTTSTTVPATSSSTTPTTAAPGPGDGDRAPTVSPDAGDGSRRSEAGPANGADTGGPDAPAGGDEGNGADDVPSATLTGLLEVGTTAGRGTVLYTADQQPVVALIGDLPAWRTLEVGVDDGADVRQLEENLVALGYGDGLDVDDAFTADTAAAVEAWETDLGRAAPDGVVSIGDVVFLTAPGDVLGHEAAVGDTLEPGAPVLTIGSEQRTIVADVDATAAGGWAPGSTVELEWADGTTSEGTVFGIGRDVTDGRVELIVAVGPGDAGAGDRRSGAEAHVTLVDAQRDGVVAVPVAAVVDDSGSPAVRVAQPSGPDQLVPVEIGLVADGWIEITAGLDGGEDIRLPG
jgi:hypothetical protein